MSDQHEHPTPKRYTVHMQGWLGFPVKRVFTGTGSSQQNGELLIFYEDGLYSINYARVRWLQVEVMEDHSHA